jgi:hypothetical protein
MVKSGDTQNRKKGTIPVRLLSIRPIFHRRVRFPIAEGIGPVRPLFSRLSNSKLRTSLMDNSISASAT